MGRSKWFIVFSIGLILSLVIFQLIHQHHYVVVSLIMLIAAFIPFIIRFERRKIEGRELVLLAVLAAVAAVSRIPFASLPSVQPTTFVVILSGMVFGSESGFVVGAVAALVSNLLLGQGPWTLWQMLAWGSIGCLSGLLRSTWWMKKRFGLCCFGIFAGYLFGFLMNIWVILSMIGSISWVQILTLYSGSFYFDTAHALSNVFFLFIFSGSWMKVLTRFKKKYGLLDR